MKKYAVLLPAFGALIFFSSCTSVRVNEVDPTYKISHVCIEKNPKVIVENFVTVIQDGFSDHSITTEVYEGERPKDCMYHLTYTALRSWDFVPYLSHAELRLFKGHEKIGDAEFHLKGKGGFAVTKWASVETKMRPVIDQLLQNHQGL